VLEAVTNEAMFMSSDISKSHV